MEDPKITWWEWSAGGIAHPGMAPMLVCILGNQHTDVTMQVQQSPQMDVRYDTSPGSAHGLDG